MTLRLTNTINRKKEIFQSLLPGKVSIYCCGVTVYDLCHLGHARSYISWDILRRYLEWKGYKVNFVQNFTDIDDKIINKALKNGCSMNELSERNIEDFFQDMDALGILRPDSMPKATQCLDEIRTLIKDLENKGAAYSIEGDVYFSVLKKNDYGKLSGRDIFDQKLNAAGRVKSIEETKKQNSFDFALWKKAKPGEPSFPSPWGDGRPGWHIECSAMVKKELGETIDIHLGGADLIFPHHENEIAQSEMVTGKELARYWLHNGMVNVEGQKMSKSLGNFTTIRSLLNSGISPMSLRLFVLQAHYRKPLDFTQESLRSASIGWKGLNTALSLGDLYPDFLVWKEEKIDLMDIKKLDKSSHEQFEEIRRRFIDAMDDDLNTSAALAVIFELARPLRSLANRLERGDSLKWNDSQKNINYCRWILLCEFSSVLGFKKENAKDALKVEKELYDENFILDSIASRKEAKQNRDFDKADKIRRELKDIGIELIDKPGGITEWVYSNI